MLLNDDFNVLNNGNTEKLITETGHSFRDKVSSIGDKGKRNWIYPKKPKGPYHTARIWVAVVLLLFFVIAPFLKVGDRPFLMLNVLERKFVIFGNIFWPQDFHIFALSFLALVFFIVLFTAVYGRVWCGWACPQTIFMEMVFRKIEYLFEGDYKKQMALTEMPWNGTKILKRGGKLAVFFIVSFIIANISTVYLVGSDHFFKYISDGPIAHLSVFVTVLIISGIIYFIFGWFREQACNFVCPYGRLQSVLLDKNSIVVGYNYVRGEPRGRAKKNDPQQKGDCIDCGECVKVCPTGIDIRNGTQLECVNCTACIDACDIVMEKVNKPKNLITFGSLNQFETGTKFKFTPRIILYSTLLVVLLTIISMLLMTRNDVEATILRSKGTIAQKTQDGFVANVFTATIINKTFKPIDVQLKPIGVNARIKIIGNEEIIKVKSESVITVTFLLEIPVNRINGTRNNFDIGIYGNGELLYVNNIMFPGIISGLR